MVAFSICATAARPKIIGHRGSGWGVENTSEAFINGAKEGYDCLETDIKVTKDGKFVCWHNDELHLSTSSTKPNIASTTLSDLQSHTLTQTKGGVTYTGTICTIEEYLDICSEYNVIPIIELKWATGINSNDQSNMDELMQIIFNKGFRNNCYIFTSMKPCLQYVKNNYPDVETMLLIYASSFDSSLEWCIANDCHIGTEVGSGVTKAGVQKYHEAGLLVNAWTIDSKSTYDTYANYGCDFITTNTLQTDDLPADDGDDNEDNDPTKVTFQTVWERSTSLGNAPSNIHGENAQQGSAHNGVFYVNNSVEKKLHIFSSGAQYLGNIPGGAGYGIDCDDAGNVIIRDDNTTDANRKFIIYPAGANVANPGTPKNISVTLPISGETHFISASGNVLGANGGYIYMFPNGQTSVCVISMANGEVNSVTQHEDLSLTGSTAGYVIPMENNPNRWIYQVRGNGYYLYNNGTSSKYQAETSSLVAPARNSTVGGEYFKLGGEEYFIHNSGENYKGGFTVRNRTTGEVITSIDPIGTLGYEEGGNYSVSNWVRAEAIDNYSAYIYQYCPANGMAVYKMSIPNPNSGNVDEPLEDAVFTLETEWQRGTAFGNAPSNIDGDDARQGTAHNGIIYVNNREEKKLHLFGSDATYLGSIPGGAGYGCDCDDVGNIIIRNENNATVNRQVIIYPAGATIENPGTPITVDITLPAGFTGNAHFVSASGNVLGGEGGYIYIFPQMSSSGINSVCVAKIVNGEVVNVTSIDGLSMATTAAGHVTPIENNPQKFLYQERGNGHYLYNSGSDTEYIKAGNATQPNCNTTIGGEFIKLGGHEIFIHNSGSAYNGGFTVRNMTTGEVIGSIAPIGNNGTNNMSRANWLRAEAIDNYSCYIYQYCPANGMAVYKLSTPAPVVDDEEDEPTLEVDLAFETVWERSNTLGNAPSDINTGSYARQGSAHNGIFYINNTKDKKLYLYGSDAQPLGSIPGGVGYGCDCDDFGNVIIANDVNHSSSPERKYMIYPAGVTAENYGTAKEITITLPTAEQADFLTASGNVLGSEGGYIYVYPWRETATPKYAYIIPVVNGQVSGEIIARTLSTMTPQAGSIAIPVNNNPNKFYYQARSNGTYLYDNGVNSLHLPAGKATPDCNSTGGAEYFEFAGEKYYILNSGTNYAGGFTLRNLTTGENVVVVEPIGNNGTGNLSRANWVRAEVVNNDICYIYQYCPENGMAVYKYYNRNAIPTDNLESLEYHYVLTNVEGGQRQDVELIWTAPDEVEPVGYKIYRNGSLIASISGTASSYTDEGVSENNTYRVVPIFDGATENAELGLEVTTTEITTILYAPIITETRSYNGYAIAQIFFKMPKLSNVKPTYFNIYRGKELLIGEITQFNYIDENLPQTIDAQTYEYTVEAVYAGATYNNTTRKSEPKLVEVTPRDWALVGYNIEEVYNVPISSIDASTLPGLFSNDEYYRQGYFYDGHWYIAQRADGVYSSNDEYVPADPNTTGGVIKIKATDKADVLAGMVSKPITYSPYVSVGLAMDDKGTIFVRNNDINKLSATAPLDGNPTSIAGIKDGFGRRITEGLLYARNTMGEYTAAPIELDLTALWLDNRWIDEMYYNGTKSYGQVVGRSDYYYMWGDVMSAEGGYLLLSPSWTRTAFKVKIANGAYVSHEVIQFEPYDDFNEYTGKTEHHIVASGTENYGFKIDGRDAWMSQIRSNGYYGIHDDEVGDEHWHAIFDADSRINNSGGTSIVAFDETFLITPACMYSKNIGDFIVTRGTKESVNVSAADAELAPPMPVAQFKQIDRSINIATNSNGNWFHAEMGTYVSANDPNAECVYIYQYVPGVRFAKYRLYPDDQMKPITPTLKIVTAYDEEKTEITHFNGVSTWKRPQDFGIAAGANAHAKVKSYTYELLNDKGEVIYSDEIIDNDYANQTPPTEASDDFVYEFKFDENANGDIKHTLDFQTYTARVAVNYEIVNESAIRQSEFGYARDNNDYPAKPARNTNVDAFVKNGLDVSYWVKDSNGEWIVETKKVNRYRIDLDFSTPDFSEEATVEPVSYYTIKAVVNRSASNIKGDTININNFLLHQGIEIKDGKICAKTTETNLIPGTYAFESYINGGDKAPYYTSINADGTGNYKASIDGGSYRDVVLSYFYDAPTSDDVVAVASNGDEIIITNTPDKWEFLIEAHYAARNAYINKNAIVGTSTESLTPTGVEVVGDNNKFAVQIYPIPATVSITIKADDAINSIVIFNESGVEVMNIEGEGDNMTVVDIENLLPGYYLVKVNNNVPVKIIKK